MQALYHGRHVLRAVARPSLPSIRIYPLPHQISTASASASASSTSASTSPATSTPTSSSPAPTSRHNLSPSNIQQRSQPQQQQQGEQNKQIKQPGSFLDRIFHWFFDDAIQSNKKHWLLNLLGYYSEESKMIALSNGLYKRCIEHSTSSWILENLKFQTDKLSRTTHSTNDEERLNFSIRWELLTIQVYLTIYRLRQLEDTSFKQRKQIKRMMQDFFEDYWMDVRHRMLIKEEGFKYLQSGKWLKECEERFFGLAFRLDKIWLIENSILRENEMRNCMKRNITCLNGNDQKVNWLARYVMKEKEKLDKMSSQDLLDLSKWPEHRAS